MPIRPSLSYTILLGLLAAACSSSESAPAGPGAGGGGTGGAGGGGAGGSGGSGGSAEEAAPLRIDTDKGPVEGEVVGSTRAFLGIPYAAPPTGALRWKPPAPHEPWTEALKAVEVGPACAQLRVLMPGFEPSSSEDCLTVNVWAPERPASQSLPVLVWIHGGSFTLGSGGEADYDGQVLSETAGAVVVTVNYRLGPLGYLALPELRSEDPDHPSTGGYGIEDQRAALEWVKANIGAFGGDPGNVTLFGESAGGISVCMHMVSPPSKGLFQRAIIESGPCDTTLDEATATAQGEAFVEALGCGDAPSVLECLRGKSAEEVITALPPSNDMLFGGTQWYPVIDGWNLPDTPGKLLEEGSFEKVPTIVGSNDDEATLFFALAGDSPSIADDAELEAFAEQLAPGHGEEVVASYPSATHGSAQAAAFAAVGDALFVCPARRAARAIAKAGVATYLYHFTYAPEGSLLGDLGSFHSAEIRYVFGNPSLLLPQPLTQSELELSRVISGYWSRHAQNGDPNGGDAMEWPRYDADTDENIVLDLTISQQAGLRKEVCDMWDSFLATEQREAE
ncbi:carboxylesterase/lipase family protein [Sorangium sp. So ce1151]|uniref:carboxylesterase/lipase family protein n=1 Tax=Sorangium sp. So ce1151 TaxID=3133332 RepID=UPI003F5D7586